MSRRYTTQWSIHHGKSLDGCAGTVSLFRLGQHIQLDSATLHVQVKEPNVWGVKGSGLSPVLLEECWLNNKQCFSGKMLSGAKSSFERHRLRVVFLHREQEPQRLGPLCSAPILKGAKKKSLFPNHCPPAPLGNNCPIKWVLEQSKNPDHHQRETPD